MHYHTSLCNKEHQIIIRSFWPGNTHLPLLLDLQKSAPQGHFQERPGAMEVTVPVCDFMQFGFPRCLLN